MQNHFKSICVLAVFICCSFQCGAAFADYDTAKTLKKSKKFKQGFDACWEEALKGESKCRNFIGYAYMTGSGHTQDLKEAVKWYRLAADQGNAKAQNNLGTCYSSGKGVAQDFKAAAHWYQLAADQKQVWGLSNLGLAYLDGKGVKPDIEQAVKLFRLAAEQDYNHAQYMLGFLYETGRGVVQDDREALEWYQLAADQHHEKAKENLESLLKKMAIAKPAKNLNDINKERISADLLGKTIEGWKIKKEYKHILKILENNKDRSAPKFTVFLFSSEDSWDSRTKGFFCKIEIEYKKIAGEFFLVNVKTIESELGLKDKILHKYYANFYPLSSAVKNNNLKLVKSLLREGEDVNEIDNYYRTPLLIAYTDGLKDIEELLISRGADVHLVGANMLAIALRKNDFASAKELLDRGVDINRKPKTGLINAQSAIESVVRNEAAFMFLVESGADIDVKSYYGGSLLHSAVDCSSGNLNVAKYLIENGLDVNAIASNGRTPLINACSCSACKPEHIQFLLDNGADINSKAGYRLSTGRDWQGVAYDWAKSSGCSDQLGDSLTKRLKFNGDTTAKTNLVNTIFLSKKTGAAYVHEFITQKWIKIEPGINSKSLSAEVLLAYSQSGDLLHYRFNKKSGDEKFDQSLVKAIYSSRKLGKPVSGKSEFSIIFNLKEMLEGK